MPCSKGRGPLVSHGTVYTLSLDPLSQQRMQDARDWVRDKLDIHTSHSAIVRRALTLYAGHLAKLNDAEPESLPLYSESHLISQCIRGSDSGNLRERNQR